MNIIQYTLFHSSGMELLASLSHMSQDTVQVLFLVSIAFSCTLLYMTVEQSNLYFLCIKLIYVCLCKAFWTQQSQDTHNFMTCVAAALISFQLLDNDKKSSGLKE